MPRGAAPPWRARKEPILDDHLYASVTQAGGVHNEQGHYATLIHAGCESRERAQEIKKALYRSAYHLDVSLMTKIIKAGDGTYSVEYTAIDKAHGKKYMLEIHGPDRSKWSYDPRRKGR